MGGGGGVGVWVSVKETLLADATDDGVSGWPDEACLALGECVLSFIECALGECGRWLEDNWNDAFAWDPDWYPPWNVTGAELTFSIREVS